MNTFTLHLAIAKWELANDQFMQAYMRGDIELAKRLEHLMEVYNRVIEQYPDVTVNNDTVQDLKTKLVK